MTDITELTQYVEENPNDHEQRWRLAKRLYNGCEYRLALEHLFVLRKEWTQRVNVVRYLAATYYRLGRYEDAVREIEYGIENWPDELGLREQLARVLEVAGRREAAADAWDEVRKRDPKHPVADSAVRRLREKESKTPEHDLNLMGSDSGINMLPGQACPNCGAQNSLEAELCWQCQAPMFSVKTGPPVVRPVERGRAISPQVVRLLAGIVVGLIVLLALASSIRDITMTRGDTLISLESFYRYDLAGSRFLTGLFLLVAWPLALHLALYALNDTSVSFGAINLSGLFLAGLVFAASCVSPAYIAPGFLLAAVLTLAIAWGGFRLRFNQALAVSSFQLIAALVTLLLTFSTAEWIRAGIFFNPISEIPAVLAYARAPNDGGMWSEETTREAHVPVEYTLEWRSTGSKWFDYYGERTTITIEPEPGRGPYEFALQNANRETYGLAVDIRDTCVKEYDVLPGIRYYVRISGPESSVVKLKVSGLLRHHIE